MLGVFVQEHARAISGYCDVVVLYGQPAHKRIAGLYTVDSDMQEEGIRTVRLLYRSPHRPLFAFLSYVLSIFGGFRYLSQTGFQPNVLHAHVFDAGVAAVLVGKVNHIPVVITEHWSGFPRGLLSPRVAILARFAFQQAYRVLPVSKALQEGIERYGIRAHFTIVPNVVDTNLFAPSPVSREPPVCKRLLFVGSLISIKGVPTLLQALGHIGQQRQDWRLDVVGDGEQRADCERMAADFGIANQISFHGYQPKREVAALMQQVDLFVLPSLWENLPCVLLEAIASGLPVVSTAIGGIPEIVDQNIGILVPPGDAVALAKALSHMLDTIESYDRFTIAQYGQRYSFAEVGRTLTTIYQGIE